MNNKKTVLVYIEQDHKYLLIHKQKPDMNFNKYMGVGGKIEAGEWQLNMRGIKEKRSRIG